MEPPRPIISTEDDGCVRIEVGNHLGWVSSMHLVDTKVRQLQTAWLNERAEWAAKHGHTESPTG